MMRVLGTQSLCVDAHPNGLKEEDQIDRSPKKQTQGMHFPRSYYLILLITLSIIIIYKMSHSDSVANYWAILLSSSSLQSLTIIHQPWMSELYHTKGHLIPDTPPPFSSDTPVTSFQNALDNTSTLVLAFPVWYCNIACQLTSAISFYEHPDSVII